jgi:hypothetical protein
MRTKKAASAAFFASKPKRAYFNLASARSASALSVFSQENAL